MGIIREPKGVDFIIQSPALTEEERKEISEFIQKRKTQKLAEENSKKANISTRKTKDKV